jgi:ubiquitin-conjugating enzyme E2 variant
VTTTRIPEGTRAASPSPERFASEPFSTGDNLFQLAGGALNLAVTVPVLIFSASQRDQLGGGWLPAAACLAVGTFVADFVSGFLHWAFDTYFSDRSSTVKRMVALVREHHVFPDRIFEYSVWREAGELSWFAALISAPMYGVAMFLPGVADSLRGALIGTGLTLSLEITFMLEFHKAGHRRERGRFVRTLQRMRLLLSPEHHFRHHTGRHDINYCLINGVADDTLGKLGVFRAMEAVIAAATGAVAREHDREVLTAFGRSRG